MTGVRRESPLKRARLASSSKPAKKIISVRMAQTLVSSIKKVMDKQGLGSRKRSSWISESIIMLEKEFSKISHADQCLFIRQAQSVSGQGISVPITLNKMAQDALMNRLAFCEANTPDINDAQSRLVHLAITLYLIKLGVKLA